MLADKIAVINQGQSCFCGSLSEFRELTGQSDLRRAFMESIKDGFKPNIKSSASVIAELEGVQA